MVDAAHGRLPILTADRPYSLGQLASVLGISHRSMLRAVKTGVCPRSGGARVKLAGYRLGKKGAWRVMGADALAWLRVVNQPEPAAGESTTRPSRLRANDVDALLDAAGF